MQKLRESKHSNLLAVSDISVKTLIQFNFDSDEDAEDIDVPSIKTTYMGIHHYRCEAETNSDVEPWQ